MLSPNEMGSPSPVCAAQGLSDKVVSLRSYGKPKEGGYTHISGSNHTELVGAGQTSVAQGAGRKPCWEMHEKGARLAPGEEPSSELWAAEIIWSCKSRAVTVQPGTSLKPAHADPSCPDTNPSSPPT